MRILIVTAAFLTGVLAMEGVAFAQAQKAPVYRYCLLEGGGGTRGGGGQMMTCRYNTLAQCMASKAGNSDSCIINPQLTFPPR
jgi:Protein of unknown function (DUF3551)